MSIFIKHKEKEKKEYSIISRVTEDTHDRIFKNIPCFPPLLLLKPTSLWWVGVKWTSNFLKYNDNAVDFPHNPAASSF